MTSPRRRRGRSVTVAAVLTVSALLGGAAGCSGSPASTIDLTGWKLTLPEEGDGGKAGEVEPAEVTEPWTTVTGDGALEFWAPASGGATTTNSSHPRTELVSLTHFRAGMDPHVLRASVTVAQVPRDGEGIIVGQIHGADDIKSVPYVMLRYQNDAVHVVVKNLRKGLDREYYPLLDGVPLNSPFEFTIADRGNGELVFTGSHAGRAREVRAPVPAAFAGATVRFQAGDYQQSDRPDGADDGGRVIFHRLAEAADTPAGSPAVTTAVPPGLHLTGPPGTESTVPPAVPSSAYSAPR